MGKETLFVIVALTVLVPQSFGVDLTKIYRTDAADKLHTYTLAGAPGTWSASQTTCNATGTSNLASISDANTLAFIDANLELMGVESADELWIGASGTSKWIETKDSTAVGASFTIASGDDTIGNDYIVGNQVTATWTFVASPATGTFGVICEVASAAGGSDGDGQFEGSVDGTTRYFFWAATTTDNAGAVAACTAVSDAWVATITTDTQLTDMGALAVTAGITTSMWLGVKREHTWKWVNGEDVDNTGFGSAPNTAGYAYLTYTTGTPGTSAWTIDAAETGPRDAICETVADEADAEICQTDGSCYVLTEAPAATWAATACDAAGGTLAVISDAAESDFINQNLARLGVKDTDELWIGAEISIGSGDWMWMGKDSVSTTADVESDDFTWGGTAPTDADAAYVVSITFDTAYGFVRETPDLARGVLCEGDAALTGADGTITIGTGANEQIFSYFSATANWDVGREICRGADGWMATIATDADLALVNTALAAETPAVTDELWIGLYRNDWTWIDGEPVTFDAWDYAEPSSTATHKASLVYSEEGLTSVWQTALEAGLKKSLCETSESAGGGDDGLSDGEIAAIAVSSVVVVGAAAGGGGYYAYSKSGSKGTVAPDDGGESGEGGKDEEEEEEEGGDAQPEEVQDD